MRVNVRLFAVYRERVGRAHLELDLPEGATVHQAKTALEARYPGLSLEGGMAAVNQVFASSDTPLREGDELAFLPPVSGGSEPVDAYGLTEGPIDAERWVRWATEPPYGAVVTFLGTTRSPNQGRTLRYLEYEAYPGMAERVLGQIIEEMRARWPLGKVAIWHRVGRVLPGEASIAIIASAPHRPEAFDAVRYAIDRVKLILPVWKKEVFEDGSAWVEGQADPAHRI